MGFFFIAFTLLSLSWLVSSVWTFYRNYRAAQKSGLPILLCPINPENVLFIIFGVMLRPALKRILPASIFEVIQVPIFGWEFQDKHVLHDKVGSAFILVTTGQSQLWCADPDMAHAILARRKDFVQSPLSSKVMGFLGENIVTSDGESWSRQRRIIAPALNERISESAWDESVEQTRQMVDLMLSMPNGVSNSAIRGLRTIAINVLAKIAYGQQRKFGLFQLPKDPKSNMNYVDGVSLCAELLVLAALLPIKLLTSPVMPKIVQTLGAALQQLPFLTKDMLDQERKRNASGAALGDNIMSSLVRLSDEGQNQEHDKQPGIAKQYLTEGEIAGNMFIFTVAGFDTTANTMAYAVTLLAANPEWQIWIQEELDHVFDGQEGDVTDYATLFPKLSRCLALMLETLRIYTPVVHISRHINTSQIIEMNDKSYLIPGPCTVYVNSPALQSYPSIWGEDSVVFKPSRWLTPDSTLANSQIITPDRGTFLPWSGGPRVCPGQKMAQVEFVAVISTLFRACKVEAAVLDGGTLAGARGKLMDLTQDSQPRVSLQMNKPNEVHLKWARR